MVKLDQNIDEAVSFLQNLNQQQVSVSFQIQALRVDLNKMIQFREHLGQSLSFYQNSTDEFYNKIEVPSQFFVDL